MNIEIKLQKNDAIALTHFLHWIYTNRYRVTCLHVVNSLVRLSSKALSLFFMMVSFSSRHKNILRQRYRSFLNTCNACFIEEYELVWIKYVYFGFKLLSEVIISLKSNTLYICSILIF